MTKEEKTKKFRCLNNNFKNKFCETTHDSKIPIFESNIIKIINPAKNFIKKLRKLFENKLGISISNREFAIKIGITKGQFDRYMYRDSPIFSKGSTLESIAYKIINDIRNESNWIDRKTFLKILRQYHEEEVFYIQNNNLKTRSAGGNVLEWVSRKFNEKNHSYPTLVFIRDLKNELGINNKELSKIFGKTNERYLDELKQRIKKKFFCPNKNSDYKFSIEVLDILRKNLIETFGNKAYKCLEFIDEYISLNEDLKEYSKQQYHLYHPKLDAHFFKVIDTSIKAYWLGFLCADGYISRTRYGRLGIRLSLKDKGHIVKFCKAIGLDPSLIKEKEVNKEYKGNLVNYKTAVIDFWCKPMYEELIDNNFKEFPNLESYDLYLAWILGLYDGDGFQGKTMVCSASKKLLEKIRNYFNIKYEVRDYYYDSNLGYHVRVSEDIEKVLIKKSNRYIYILTLGSHIFNKMMNNYENSLERKRKEFSELHETYENLKEQVGNKSDLQDLINKYPKNQLVDMLNTTEYALDKLINVWKLKRSWNSL